MEFRMRPSFPKVIKNAPEDENYRSYQNVADGGAVYRVIMILLREGAESLSMKTLLKAFLHYDEDTKGASINCLNEDIRVALWDGLRRAINLIFTDRHRLNMVTSQLDEFVKQYFDVIDKILLCGKKSLCFDEYFKREEVRKRFLYATYLDYSLKELESDLIDKSFHIVHMWAVVAVEKVRIQLDINKPRRNVADSLASLIVRGNAVTSPMLKRGCDTPPPNKPFGNKLDFGDILKQLFGWQLIEDGAFVFLVHC